MQKIWQQFNSFTKILLAVSLILIVYGYLARGTGIYFFWEGDSIGWILFLIVVIVFLTQRIRTKKANQQRTTGEKVVIGLIVFIFLMIGIVASVIPNLDAYAAARSFLKNDPSLKGEIGNVTGFGFLPVGSVQVTSTNGASMGVAELSLIVKGDKKYKQVVVLVTKSLENPNWVVESVE